ncbi:uncharacterized protein [Amphiura filiformis]|uniref:uncharacterized protein n=1 Tax=Amphiura filiformis TaxID=82378 RepID=UPI003B220430
MRSTRPKSRLPVPVSTNTNNNKMAVASLPSTYTKFPLRILNKGPEYFRDQMGQDRGHVQSHKSAAERLAETRTQYVRSVSKESESQERVTSHAGGKETTQEMVQKLLSSPKKRNRTERRAKSQNAEHAAAGDISDTNNHRHDTDLKKFDVTASGDGKRISKSEEEMRSVGNLISHYSNGQNGYENNPTNRIPPFGKRSPPQIPKKPKRCVSPSNKSCSDSDEMPFKRISVKQAAKSWENVSSIFDSHRNGVRKQPDVHPQFSDETDSTQRVVDSNSVKLKAASIAKAWEKLTADLDCEENGKKENGKKGNPPPKVKLIDNTEECNTNSNNHTTPTAVKVKLTDGGSTSQQHAKLSKPLKVQLINNYNTGKTKEQGDDGNRPGNQSSQAPIRAKVKVVDSNMNNVSGSTVYERKDPKRAIRGKVEQVDKYTMGKVTSYSNHISRHSERPRVQTQLSNQSEETNTDSSLSAKVRLLLVQSKDNQTNVDHNNTSNGVKNNESPTRGRTKNRKTADKSRNVESTKENNYRSSKHSPQHQGRSKSSGPLYRMHLGSSQESAQTQSYDSTKNTDTSSPRSSSPCLGSPRGSRIRRLQEQLLSLCDTEDSSSFDSPDPDSLGDGKFVRSRSSRSYSKDSINEDWGLPRRGSAPTRHKNKGKEHSSEKSPEKSKVSSKGNVIVERRDMPVPIQVVRTSKPTTDSSKIKNKTSSTPVQRKDTKSSFDSMDARLASTSEATNEFKETCDKIQNELFIIETPCALGESPTASKKLDSTGLEDSPSSSTKEKYSRMTAIMLGSGVKTEIGAIDNLPISIDVEVEYDDEDDFDKKRSTDKPSRKENVIDSPGKQKSVSKTEVKSHERSHQKYSSRKHKQISTDSEDIPSASAAAVRDKSSHKYETPKADPIRESKHHRKSARESRKKLFVYEDPDQQSADQIKSCHSPNLNNNRPTDGFQRGTQMRRSCSDLDPPYLHKAHSDLDRFFDRMGLDESVLKRIDSHSPTEEEAFHPMHEMKYYDSDSMYSNESDNISQGSKVSDDGLLRRHLTSRLPDQSQSIVMRNARVIKWLCHCRKARTQSVS